MVKECCNKKENLILQKANKHDLTIYKCNICNCKHYKLKVDSGKLFAKEK